MVLHAPVWNFYTDSWVATPREAFLMLKVAPTNMTQMLFGCIICILIIVDMPFAIKGIE